MADYVHPQERWALQNRELKMLDWMLNMVAEDEEKSGHANVTEVQRAVETISEVRRGREMWKARAHYVQKENEEMKMECDKHLSGMKKKKSLMRY